MRKFDFGRALQLLREGVRVTRQGWNGKGQFIALMPGYPDGVGANEVTVRAIGVAPGSTVVIRPYLVIRAVDGSIVPWLASQTDLLAEDWYSVSASAD